MMVPADAAVMTNGRPYVGLVAATAVALRVAKLSPSILTTRDGVSRRSRHELVACLAVTSHRTQSETGDSALVYVFPSASSIRVSACRRTSAGGSRPSFSGEQTGSSSLGPGGIALDRRLGAARSEDPDAAH